LEYVREARVAGRYFEPEKLKQRGTGEHYTVRSFIVCTVTIIMYEKIMKMR
jgi:hypothetical protein